MMRRDELQRWMDKNLRENADHILKPGDIIKDQYGIVSTVVGVFPPLGSPSPRNHGMIRVRSKDGSENHYAWWNWQKNLRIVTF